MSHSYHHRTLHVRQSFICYRDERDEVASRENKSEGTICIQYVYADVTLNEMFYYNA